MNKHQTSLAGKFFVLAQLSMRDFVLGETGSDGIPVSSPKSGKLVQLEVRTTRETPSRSAIFGFNYKWMMSKRQEAIRDDHHVYCFVFLQRIDEMPRFFLVPSNVVADYLASEHAFWLAQPHNKEVKSTDMRAFKIGLDATSHGLIAASYENNWELLNT